MNDPETLKLAHIIWDFLLMKHEMFFVKDGNVQQCKADAILVLGSHDLRVAERGAQLFIAGHAPLLIMSGGFGNLTLGKFEKPEADLFADVAIKCGVPSDSIIIENKSTNTAENFKFTQKLLNEKKIDVKSLILVQKPYMEKRTYAAFMKNWEGASTMEVYVTSPQLSLEEYVNEEISFDTMINVAVGDLQRIRIYPEKGFQIPMEIPDDVWKAYLRLVELGYSKNLVK